jgi:hypothetical protein
MLARYVHDTLCYSRKFPCCGGAFEKQPIAPMVAWLHRGAPLGLRSHPLNLIRFVPAKGGA